MLAREIAAARRDPVRIRRAVTFAFWANSALGIGAAIVTTLIVLTFASVSSALIVGSTTLLLAIGSTGLGILQGEGRTVRLAVVFAIESVAKVAAGTALVFAVHMGISGALLGGLAGSAVVGLCVPTVLKDVGRPASRAEQSSLWQSTRRIARIQVAVGVMASLDSLLIALDHGTRAVGGPYQVASAIGKVPIFFASAISTAVFPLLAHEMRGDVREVSVRSYATVAGFCILMLSTVPSQWVRFLFPAQYASLRTWLPLTAVLGAGLGALNLLTTFVQSDEQGRTSNRVVVASMGLMAAAGAVGGSLGGVAGLAWACTIAVWVAVAALSVLPRERGALLALGRHLRQPFSATAVLCCVLVTVALRGSVVAWSVAVVAIGGATLLVAFPELVGRPSATYRA